jgi:hypothetical protein
MTRVIRRSVARAVMRTELWNGNRERARSFMRASHPIRWSWTHHERKRMEYEARFEQPEYDELDVYRFPTPREASAWLEGVIA